jgi:cysteine-rich repeat protein
MSYSCPNDPYIARLGYLSNPDVSYAGRPTGDASRANNARVLRENRFYVANFRSSQSSASAPAPSPVCGNGIVEGSEECDDGNTSSGDGCADDCTVEFCGDGVLQAGLGEDCDDGNTRNGDGCSSSCMVEVSGPSPTPPVSTPAATPSPSPTPEAAGGSSSWGGTFAVHMGCFLDDPAERALYGSFKDFKDALTPEECSQHCDDEGWSIAGMQAGSECYCGTGAYVTHGEGTCDSKCTGDSSTLCGGKSSNSVYAVATGCAPSNLGCYNRELNQLLTGKSTSDPSMTVELCDDFCEGYDLFMVSQGTDCYCGNDAFGSPGPSSECNQACGGDKNQVCGGANAVSIFTVSASRPAGQPLCS